MKVFYIVFALFPFVLSAQPAIQWQKSYGGSEVDLIHSIKPTNDGGYIATGLTSSNDGNVTGYHAGQNNPYDIWVVKMNVLGEIEWQRCYGGSNYEYASEILQTQDGGYIFVGTTSSVNGDISQYQGGYSNCWVVKLSNSGAIEWENTYGAGFVRGASIVQLASGDYVVGGEIGLTYWIFKITANGNNVLWSKKFGGSQQESLSNIVQTTDNGFLLGGYSWSNDGDVSGHHGSTTYGDYWVVKVDSEGTLVWQKSLGGSFLEQTFRIIATSDGGSLVSGFSYSDDGDVSGLHGGPVGQVSDAWIVKLNASGTILWQKMLGGSFSEYLNAMYETPSGEYMLAGLATSLDGDVDTTQFQGSGDAWIITLSAQGSLVSQWLYGGSEFEKINTILPTNDGGLIFGGTSSSSDGDLTSIPQPLNENYWIVKLGALTAAEEVQINPVHTYPNPGTDVFYLQLPENDPLAAISIVDFSGAPVNTYHLTRQDAVDMSNAPVGVYFISCISRSGKQFAGKWVKGD